MFTENTKVNVIMGYFRIKFYSNRAEWIYQKYFLNIISYLQSDVIQKHI